MKQIGNQRIEKHPGNQKLKGDMEKENEKLTTMTKEITDILGGISQTISKSIV